MPRISNNDVRSFVERRERFITHNETMFGGWFGDNIYAVHSYGHHFPMYVYDAEADQWFGNEGKASRTTSVHQTKARPSFVKIAWADTEFLRTLIRNNGYAATLARRILDTNTNPEGWRYAG